MPPKPVKRPTDANNQVRRSVDSSNSKNQKRDSINSTRKPKTSVQSNKPRFSAGSTLTNWASKVFKRSSTFTSGVFKNIKALFSSKAKRRQRPSNAKPRGRQGCCGKLGKFFSKKRKSLQTAIEDVILDVRGNMIGNEPMLTGAEEEGENEDDKKELALLTYSQTLHRSLKFLWIPMFVIGRIPFRLNIERNRATVVFNKCSFSYLACALGALLCWVLFFWFTIHVGSVVFQRDDLTVEESRDETKLAAHDIKFLERRIMKKYRIDLFIFWTTLFQAAFASTHILVFGKNYGNFVKQWYKVLDSSKTQISKSLVQFILMHYAFLFCVVALMVIVFFIPESFPPFTHTCQMIAAPFIKPLYTEDKIHNGGDWYFEPWAFLGLLIYLVAVIFAWFSVIIYLVFARCFRNALHLINQRIRMMLHPMDEPKIGPNAIRLDYLVIHKDFVQIAFVGIKAGYVFGHVICCFYMTSTLCVVFELGSLVSFGSENPTTDKSMAFLNSTFASSNIRQKDPAAATILNLFGHLALSIATIVVSSWENAECYREGREAYQLATYKGLFLATTQIERNFIRSLWILASDRFPLTVTSQGYFKMTRGMLIAFLSCIITYFIFLVQSKGQLEGVTDKAGYEKVDINSETAQLAIKNMAAKANITRDNIDSTVLSTTTEMSSWFG